MLGVVVEKVRAIGFSDKLMNYSGKLIAGGIMILVSGDLGSILLGEPGSGGWGW
jgi:hypothetical protein